MKPDLKAIKEKLRGYPNIVFDSVQELCDYIYKLERVKGAAETYIEACFDGGEDGISEEFQTMQKALRELED
jgi:hypothetical protein